MPNVKCLLTIKISDWSNCQYYQVKEKTTSSFISLITKLVLSINELNIHIIYYS